MLVKADAERINNIVIRFAGDSGDGMQLTGSQFAASVAKEGSEIATLPDFPSEIRAPAGTTSGVSGYQLHFGASNVLTPGDDVDILVAMNPAALRVNVDNVANDGLVIIDKDAFTQKNMARAGYTEGEDPLSERSTIDKQIFSLPITSRTLEVLSDSEIPKKDRTRCKNFFTLGLLLWLHDHPLKHTIEYIQTKFASKPALADANIKVLEEGMLYAQNCGMFQSRFRIEDSTLPAGDYRNISGNQAIALGLVTAAHRAQLELFLGSYPITPATEILQELALLKNYGVKTFQAEDEIAGICSALGAAFSGALAVTTTSGPGMSLKAEALGLAVISELPLVIVNVQRGGPSTGLPTKTEQSDLMQALHGRHGECPLPVIAAKTPEDCFHKAIEASRLALKYMTPVILLSDGYLGNGSSPFQIPQLADLPDLSSLKRPVNPEGFSPYRRDKDTLARNWAIPGTPDLQHRLGGLEKDYTTGAVSHDSENHELMTQVRQDKIERIAKDIPPLEVYGDKDGGDIAILSWGSTYGAIHGKVRKYRTQGKSVSHIHFDHLNPMPENTEKQLRKFQKIVVAEMNFGQLNQLIRAKYLIDTIPLQKVKGKPFREEEIAVVIDGLINQ